MAVPSDTVFGIDEKGDTLTYGSIRNITDDDTLISLLKLRINKFFLEQVLPLESHWSPFPLTIMACIGIETLGKITISESSDDHGYQFKKILGKFDKRLSRTLTKREKIDVVSNWPNGESERISNLSDLFYKYYRNTMIHGYRGKGAFLHASLDEMFIFNNGYLIINPKIFWFRFKIVFDEVFEQLSKDKAKGSGERTRCLQYIKDLLE